MLRVDLHLHSDSSPDSSTSLRELVETCRRLKLDRIALTDHNTASGAIELANWEPTLAIVGEEVKSSDGEIIGLFIDRTIRRGADPASICDEVHSMGGLVYVAHPFDPRRAHFSRERLAALSDRIDIVEVYNAWCDPESNRKAQEFCDEFGKVAATGSDAHSAAELGLSWMEMDEYISPRDFLVKLGRARHGITPQSGMRMRAR